MDPYMKKFLRTLGIIALSIISLVILWFFFRPAPDYTRIPVQENEEDYTRIAEIYYEDYLNNHERLNEDRMAYSIADHSRIISYELNDIRDIELDEEETVSANVIIDTYRLDQKPWERVYVYDNFVSFCTITGRESLVYSVDGKRPSYVNSPDESKNIIVHRITKHWFHCCELSLEFLFVI